MSGSYCWVIAAPKQLKNTNRTTLGQGLVIAQ